MPDTLPEFLFLIGVPTIYMQIAELNGVAAAMHAKVMEPGWARHVDRLAGGGR